MKDKIKNNPKMNEEEKNIEEYGKTHLHCCLGVLM